MAEGAKFLVNDRLLDAAATGPRWLDDPKVAAIVILGLLLGAERGEFDLGPWVLMSNHVHLILRPHSDMADTIRRIKCRSALEANQIMGRSGAFWARDYFDHWIRDRTEEQRITRYIANNPVKAGLCTTPEAWPWSSCNARYAAHAACP